MTALKPIEYSEAPAAVRAVFDDIKKTRNVPDVNNFWKYLDRERSWLKKVEKHSRSYCRLQKVSRCSKCLMWWH